MDAMRYVIVACLLLAACGGSDAKPTPTPEPSPEPTATIAAPTDLQTGAGKAWLVELIPYIASENERSMTEQCTEMTAALFAVDNDQRLKDDGSLLVNGLCIPASEGDWGAAATAVAELR